MHSASHDANCQPTECTVQAASMQITSTAGTGLCWNAGLVMDWLIGLGLADWRWIGRLAMDWWIGNGLADWRWIGRLAMDWWIGDGLVMDWQIGPGLTLDWQIGNGLVDW